MASFWARLAPAGSVLLVLVGWLLWDWPPLVHGQALEDSVALWSSIFGLGSGPSGGTDPRALPLLLVQLTQVVPQLLRGVPRPEILQALQDGASLWHAWVVALTLLASAGAVALVARRGFSGLSAAVLLGTNALWLSSVFAPGPAIVWGLFLAAVLRPELPSWARGAALGGLLGTSTLGVPVYAGALTALLVTRGTEARRAWATTLVLSLPMACLWNPEVLVRTGEWMDHVQWNLRLLGFFGPMPEVYIRPDDAPRILFRELGPFLPVVAVLGVLRGARGARGPWLAVSGALAVTLLTGATMGRIGRDEAVAVTPWVAVCAGWGVALLWDLSSRWVRENARRSLAVALAGAVLAPVWIPAFGEVLSWARPSAERACIQWLEENAEEGSWVVLDPRAPAPRGAEGSPAMQRGGDDSPSEVRYLRIPSHRLRPDLYRGVFWTGWYLPFDYLVLSARTPAALLDRSERYADILAFYTEALMRLDERATFGGPGWRDPKISIFALPGDSLGAGWRERILGGPEQGLPPDFLVALGTGLGGAGAAEGALGVLTRALDLGSRSPALYANLAALHLGKKEYKRSADVLEEGLGIYPDHPGLLHNLGLTFARGGLPRRAVQVYTRLVQKAPWDDDAKLELAAAFYLDGQHDRARLALADYQRRVPPGERPEEARELARELGVSSDRQ